MRLTWILLILILISCTPPNTPPTISKPEDKTVFHNTLAQGETLEVTFTINDLEDTPEKLTTSASFDKPDIVTALAPISCTKKTCTLSLRIERKQVTTVKATLVVTDTVGAKATSSFAITVSPKDVTVSTGADFITLIDQAQAGESIRINSGLLKLSEQILLDKELSLWGMGLDKTILDAQNLDRIFWIQPEAKVVLYDMTLQNGKAKDEGSTLADEPLGGAIFNEGILGLERVRILNSKAVRGGGVYNYDTGLLTLKESIIGEKNKGNSASRSGGGLFNDSGKMNVLKSQVSFNQGVERGGGIYNHFNGLLVVEESTFDGNISWDGTAIKNDNDQTGTATTIIRKSVIQNHQASQFEGGAIFNRGRLELYESSVTKNATLVGEGGGIYSLGPTSVVILDNTTVSENNGAGNGGGINNTNALSTLIIRNGSKIVNNQSSGSGGGIFNEGKLTVTADCEISGNRAGSGRRGGGMYSVGQLVNTTKETLIATVKNNQPDNIYPELP